MADHQEDPGEDTAQTWETQKSKRTKREERREVQKEEEGRRTSGGPAGAVRSGPAAAARAGPPAAARAQKRTLEELAEESKVTKKGKCQLGEVLMSRKKSQTTVKAAPEHPSRRGTFKAPEGPGSTADPPGATELPEKSTQMQEDIRDLKERAVKIAFPRGVIFNMKEMAEALYVALEGGLKKVEAMGTIRRPNEWQVTFHDIRDARRMVAMAKITVKDHIGFISSMGKSTYRLRVHWAPYHLSQQCLLKSLTEELPEGAEIVALTYETLNIQGFECVRTTTRQAVINYPGPAADLPHLVPCVQGREVYELLLTTPGRQPLCLRCHKIGHRRKECNEDLRTWANIAKNKTGEEEEDADPEDQQSGKPEVMEATAQDSTGVTESQAETGERKPTEPLKPIPSLWDKKTEWNEVETGPTKWEALDCTGQAAVTEYGDRVVYDGGPGEASEAEEEDMESGGEAGDDERDEGDEGDKGDEGEVSEDEEGGDDDQDLVEVPTDSELDSTENAQAKASPGWDVTQVGTQEELEVIRENEVALAGTQDDLKSTLELIPLGQRSPQLAGSEAGSPP